MAAIEGLAEEHCQILASAQMGDLVLIRAYPKTANDYPSDEDSDAGSEDSQEGGENVTESNEEREAVNGADYDTDQEIGEGNDDAADDEIDQEDDSEDVDEDFANAEVESIPPPTAYIIDGLMKNANDNIDEINLRKLTYCSKPADATSSTFQIYGRRVKVNKTSATSITAPEDQQSNSTENNKQATGSGDARQNSSVNNVDKTISIQEVIDAKKFDYLVQLKPSGHDIRNTLFSGRCPAGCNEGFISTQEAMHQLVSEPIRIVSPYMPVCPVCIGKRLMRQHQTLRETYQDSYQVDFGSIHDFYSELNPKRKALGYAFQQFDEREWGMEYDDMLSESEDGDGQANGGYWEQWDEANDPNSNPTYHPASEAAIAAISQKTLRDVQNAEQAKCLVCIQAFADDALVAELPCGHYFDVECVQSWLKKSNSCPTCRKKLPAVEVDQVAPDGEVDGENIESAGEESAEAKDSVDDNSSDVKMDGEDVVMKDTQADMTEVW